MSENYMAIAFGRGELMQRVYGTIAPYEKGKEFELKEFYRKAADGKIDIKFLGESKEAAQKSLEGLTLLDSQGIVDLAFSCS